ncbi:MAG: UDP-N-acetylmuramoyl-L-alanyl-D-glutamate--2,6-diaminopimelate ligase [Bacteroidales bacterium]|nr:UDP-N-acetylmuramoyl-L-alanyl-D-glutamate--2,6-diaminopimelate ligase [Bacteroidales bacterium]
MSSQFEILNRIGPDNPQIKSLCFDSRQVEEGAIFFAIRGTQTDGHDYIDQAVGSGATTVVCETIPGQPAEHISYIQVRDAAEALGWGAAAFHGNPSENIKVIGVTGTNGKTTIATLLYQLFTAAGEPAGLISTVRNMVGNKQIPATHTTPDTLQINQMLSSMVEAGCGYCFMEVSSHAIHQKRTAGIRFEGGIFTNITHEHLDYHKTFRDYINVKKVFFDGLPATAFALVNRDDKNGKIMVQNCPAKKWTYGMQGIADVKGKLLESHLDGMHLDLDGFDFWSRLVGKFNAYNLLAVYGCSILCGMEKERVLTLLSEQTPVEGRFETLSSDRGITGIVDYAHTPDALKNVLTAIEHLRNGNRKIITVVGAGGNRDRGKRPLMGQVAADLSQKVILTSDNPRDEKPEEIIKQMMAGIPDKKKNEVLSIPDRREAIKTAVMLASVGDIVLVAGKGHETYQEIKGTKYPFDDREILKDLLAGK